MFTTNTVSMDVEHLTNLDLFKLKLILIVESRFNSNPRELELIEVPMLI